MTESGTLILLLGIGGLVVFGLVCWRLTRLSHRVSSVRRSSAIPLKASGSSAGPSRQPSTEDAVAALLGLAAVALVGVVAFKGLQKGFAFLKGLDWDSLDPVTERGDRIRIISARLATNRERIRYEKNEE